MIKKFFRKIRDFQNRPLEKKLSELSESVSEVRELLVTTKDFISNTTAEVRNIEKNSMNVAELRQRLVAIERLSTAMHDIIGNTVLSYIQNEFVSSARPQTDSIRQSEIYRYFSRFHVLTERHNANPAEAEKCRVGRTNDGGYIMLKPFSREKIAYSFGICDDVSWDIDMAEDGYQIYQYDHTIDRLPQEHDSFHWQKLGLTGGEGTDDKKGLETLLAKNGHTDTTGMLLKMDIEGDEWDVFAGCPRNVLEQFDQIVVEFHNCAFGNRPLILRALEKLNDSFAVIHVHANNYRPNNYCGDLVLPDVLEVTYVRRGMCKLEKGSLCVPETHDMPNYSNLTDFWLGEWNVTAD